VALEDLQTVRGDAVQGLLEHSRFPETAGYYLEEGESALVHHGDLRVPGDLVIPLHDDGPFHLVVLGDLLVDGRYADCDDPACSVLVTGSMRAQVVVTNGRLEVGGDLTADLVLGDYNDHLCQIGGTLRCRVFFPEEHFFEAGSAEIDLPLGLTNHRLELADGGELVCADEAIEEDPDTGDERELYAFYRSLFAEELVSADEVHEDGSVFDVYVSTARANGLIREGRPVRASRQEPVE